MKSNNSEEKRKLYLFLPVLIIPCSAFIFSTLGGGKESNIYNKSEIVQGLNTSLPIPIESKGKVDKMAMYDVVRKDSLRKSALQDKDPYYQEGDANSVLETALDSISDKYISFEDKKNLQSKQSSKKELVSKTKKYKTEILSDINQIYKQLDKAQSKENKNFAYKDNSERKFDPTNKNFAASGSEDKKTSPSRKKNRDDAEFEEIEKMVKQLEMKESSQSRVAEESYVNDDVKNLDKMLDKILDIQNPDRAKERLIKESTTKKKNLYAVNLNNQQSAATYTSINQYDVLKGDSGRTYVVRKTPQKSFYGLSDDISESQNVIKAVVHESKTVVNGSTIKLRLLDDVLINGTVIPKNNFIYGICQISNNRLNIIIPAINYKNNIHPIELSAFDVDGIQGINIPGSVERQIAKQGAGQSATGFDPGIVQRGAISALTSQAVNITKKIVAQNARVVRVELKSNYQVLLKNNKI